MLNTGWEDFWARVVSGNGAQQIYYHLFSKVMSVAIHSCNLCDQVFKFKDKFDAHMNQHLQPHELVPKTNPNHIQKVGLSKVLHLDDSTDESDIAVRSILPDQMPRQEVEKRDVRAPDSTGLGGLGIGPGFRGPGYGGPGFGEPDFGGYGAGPGQGRQGQGDRKVGRAVGPGGVAGKGVQLLRGQGAPVNDRLDLDSNPVRTDVQRYDEDPLNIEKVVDLKPKKTMVARKEIHKYQNTHNAARQTIDTGGCDRKVQGNPLSQSRNIMMAPPEPVYEIKEDVKPFISLATDPKATATVNFSRKTGQASQYNAIDTKSLADPGSRGRVSRPGPLGEDDYPNNGKVNDQPRRYSESEQGNNVKNGEQMERRYPRHPHECPDCHGFYCMTCKSTIPPSMRPFWDENEKPDMIQYYKSLQKEYERQYEQRWQAQKNCKECHNHGHKKVEQ